MSALLPVRFGCALATTAALALAACGTSDYYAAVGAVAEVPTWQGDCKRPEDNEVLRFRNGYYEALKPGKVTLKCADGRVRILVRPIARLDIEGPSRLDRGAGYFTLRAYDDRDRELRIGGSASVSWSLDGPLREGEACNHMLGTCRKPWQLKVHTTGTGPATIQAHFAGHQTTKTLSVAE